MKLLFLYLSILLAPAFSYAAGGDFGDRPSKTRKKRIPYPEKAEAERDDTELELGVVGPEAAYRPMTDADFNAEEAKNQKEMFDSFRRNKKSSSGAGAGAAAGSGFGGDKERPVDLTDDFPDTKRRSLRRYAPGKEGEGSLALPPTVTGRTPQRAAAAKVGGPTLLPILRSAEADATLPGITGRTRTRQQHLRESEKRGVVVPLPYIALRSNRRDRGATPSLNSRYLLAMHPIVLSSWGISTEAERIMRDWFPGIIIENGIGYLPESGYSQ
jgi:hypothetical protein